MASDPIAATPLDVERSLAGLVARAPSVPFVTLVEHLERLLRVSAGASGLARDERIRFRHDPNLVFHPGDVAAMRTVGQAVEITSTFLGATGTVSPLASFFTEDVLRAEGHEGGSLAAFYDTLHHRLIALCYRALRRPRLAWSIRKVGDDEFMRRALAAVGLEPERTNAPLSSAAMLGRSRIFARRPRGRQALEAALALAFPGLRIRILEFLPRRVRLEDEERLRLGVRNHRLGTDTRLGRHMQGQSDLLRLLIGPVDRITSESFLPGAHDHTRLRAIVERVTGGMKEVEAEIEIQRGHEPRACLGQPAGAGIRSRLGRSTLLRRSGSGRPVYMRLSIGGASDSSPPGFHQDA